MRRRDFLAATVTGSAAALAVSRLAIARPQESPPKRKFHLKYAPHFGMFSNHAKDEIDQIAFMADEGFTAFEDNGMRGRPKELQDKIAAALEKRGMTMGIFVAHDGAFGPPILTSGDAAARDRFLASIRESVEVAKRLRAKWVTVVPGTVDSRLEMGFQTANVIEGLKRAAEICEPSGLVMVCEGLNGRDHPGQFLRTSDQTYALMKAVGSPSCKYLMDLYHQQVSEGNLISNIDRCWDEIAYFQIGDNPGRCEPGTGEVNYGNVFRHIHSKGYPGVLGMEHGNSKGGKEGELGVIKAYVDVDSF
jgi:hydroxypyruvate isomerase